VSSRTLIGMPSLVQREHPWLYSDSEPPFRYPRSTQGIKTSP
jgi:hypothetical protein